MEATVADNKVILSLPDSGQTYRLERKHGNAGLWLVYTALGFQEAVTGVIAEPIQGRFFVDELAVRGLYQYRVKEYDGGMESAYEYSKWARNGSDPVGYTFGNYHPAEGDWGEVMTPDDIRETWVWGTDFKSNNGSLYSDEQIKFFIDAAVRGLERTLNISIKKTRIVCEPELRGLKKGADYDEDESYYPYKRARVQRNGTLTLRKRPIMSVSRFNLMCRNTNVCDLLPSSFIDKKKGRIEYLNRMSRISDSYRAVETAISPYGTDSIDRNFYYAVDYTAGYENSDEVPADLREVVGKIAAVSILNIIGDGLMSGFANSSLSMDGVSESVGTTMSATSAYFGARIKVYEDEISDFITKNKWKFNHIPMGAL